ncbi:MAG: branched-chain amino acid ABC transporter permease [Nitrososphaerota archaeon]|nr:branched-chain amino acid ABC transporter permease [Nitrososphaerota archaeon]
MYLLAVGLLAVAAVVPVVGLSSLVIDVMLELFIFAFVSLGWNLLAGFAGQVNLGPALYFGIGAYSAGILFQTYRITPWAAFAVGPAIAAAFALLTGYPTFKLKGDYYALATLVISQIVLLSFLAWNYVGAAYGLAYDIVPFSWYWFQFNTNHIAYYYVGLVMVLGALGLTWRIRNSEFGLRLMAIRDDEEGAKSIGINTLRYKLIISMISAGVIAIGGILYAQYTLYLDPNSTMSLTITADIALPALLGGVGTILGPLLGAAIIQPLEWLLRLTIGTNLQLAIRGAIFMLIVLFVPRGIVQTVVDRYIRPKMVKK